MKVLRLIESFYPVVNGATKEAFHFSNELEKRKIQSPIYTTYFNASNSPKEEKIHNVHVKRFKSLFKFMKFIYTPSMIREIKINNFDLIHIHNYRGYHAHIGYKIAKKKKIPYVINPCGSLYGYKHIFKGIKRFPYFFYDFLTCKKVIKNADRIIVESKIEYKEAIKFGVDASKIKIIPMGIDSKKYKKTIQHTEISAENPLKLLFVGRISRNRNLEPIIEAMEKVEDVKLKIVGNEAKSSMLLRTGYLDELKEYVNLKNLNKKVDFQDAKYGEDLINEYKQADCFIYTSLSENFGQTIFEAATTGLPLICTSVGIANEILIQNETGFFVDFYNPNDIIEAINKLKLKSLRIKFSTKIQGLISDKYNWNMIIREYIKIYEDAIENFGKS